MNEIHLLLNTANRYTNPNVSKGHNTVAHLQDLVQKSPWQSSLSNHKPEESTNITIQTDRPQLHVNDINIFNNR